LAAGTLLGANLLARVVATAIHATSPPETWTGTAFAISLIGSLILVLLVAALGAPARPEEEHAVQVVYKTD
jgi:hypothetical protein